MKLKVLVDNYTHIDDYYLGEPGLSFYIEEEENKILFDTGYSDVFLRNAEKMDIDLSKINYLILSHGHNDHTGGLKYLKDNDLSNVTLICHPEVFLKREHNGKDISSPVELKELNVKEYIDGTDVVKISDRLYFLGQIERVTSFENNPVGTRLIDGKPDYLQDDSALVFVSRDGLFIITACSHSGICNIIEKAKRQFNDDRILGVIGGFHLLKDDEQLKKTVNYLEKANIKELYPCHCVCQLAKFKMYEKCNVKDVGVGSEIKI